MNSTSWLMQANDMTLQIRNFINGRYLNISQASNPPITKYSPGDGSLLYKFNQGTKADVDNAVSAARQTFTDGCWCHLTLADRKNILLKLVDLIEAHKEELANDSCYGLAAYAATKNLGRAQRLAQKINAGFMIITETTASSGGDISLSIEGHRQSGIGFDGGLTGLLSYTVNTSVYMVTET